MRKSWWSPAVLLALSRPGRLRTCCTSTQTQRRLALASRATTCWSASMAMTPVPWGRRRLRRCSGQLPSSSSSGPRLRPRTRIQNRPVMPRTAEDQTQVPVRRLREVLVPGLGPEGVTEIESLSRMTTGQRPAQAAQKSLREMRNSPVRHQGRLLGHRRLPGLWIAVQAGLLRLADRHTQGRRPAGWATHRLPGR